MSTLPQKIRILKYTAEQGVVSIDDVIGHLGDVTSSSSVRVSMHQMGLGRMKYGKVRHGVWFINKQEHLDQVQAFSPEMPSIPLGGVSVSLIPHSLELNSIRNAFENSTKLNVAQWLSEACLRALPPAERDGFNPANIPDAVFWRFRSNGTRQKYFLEFERSLKNPNRYKDIFTNYARREDTGCRNVIYICRDDFIKDNLQRIERKLVDHGFLSATEKYIQFVTLEGFYKTCGYKPSREGERQWTHSNEWQNHLG